ncbi:MAG: hypothetical protein IJZ88_01240 [Clostridia bacterium]|nr:hypothetical protein [Clostridia bacterium]
MNNNRQPDNVKKAQADSSPELSSILKEMKNGIDLQPLDDIQSSDFVEFEDNVTETGQTIQEDFDKTELIKPDSKKRELSKKLARAGIISALIVCVIAAIYIAFFHLDDFSYGAVAVYEKNSAVNVLLENKDILQLENVAQIELSDNGKVLTYSQDTDSKTGKYDIRVIDFTKRNSVKNKGSVIVSGIDEDWYMEKSGSFIYYQREENGSRKYYAYSTQSRETEMIVADASEYFVPPEGDIVYYTRERSGTIMLYRSRFGEEPESLGDVSNVKAISDSETLEIFYTLPESDMASTLYKISGNGQPIKISENVTEVYLEEYVPGGNLYYFIKNKAKLNWNDFIDDAYQDIDATTQKPDKGDYLKTVGFFFKRTKLDEQAYNSAMAEYNKKLLRDEIRNALNELDLGLAVPAEYKVKVYDGTLSKELAGSVKLENLIAFSATGAPRIIFETSGIDSQKRTDMDSLYEIAESKTVGDAIDYVINTLNDNYEISEGYKYSWYDGSKVTSYDFEPDGNAYADFTFLDRNRILTSVLSGETVSNLYVNTVGDKTISDAVLISDNVLSFEVKDGNVYFTKLNKNHADLYVYTADGKVNLINQNNIQFIVTDSNNVIAFSGVYKNGGLADTELAFYTNGASKKIDSDVSFKYFSVDEESFAYIKNYQTAAASDSESASGGELIVYHQGKAKSIDTDVTMIYCINY